MAEAPNLEAILAALAAQKAPASTTPQTQPPYQVPVPAPGYPPAQPPYQAPPPAPAPGYPPAQPPAYPYPQPTASGSLDLPPAAPAPSAQSAIKLAIERAKAHAAQNGVTPYDGPINYGNQQPRPSESGRYRTSRSRSPPPRRETYRDDYSAYRDERRADRGDQGRGYNRDRSFSPRGRDRNGGTFSPRGAHGSARQRSPMRGGDRDRDDDPRDRDYELVDIESSLVGLIIGRQGENMKNIEGKTGSRVQFLPASGPDDAFRKCKVKGTPAERAKAKEMINRIIEDSGMGPIARGGRNGGRGGAPPMSLVQDGPSFNPDDEAALQIMVPDKTVGLIIGRGGETIRDLQEKSGCHVNIVGENKSVHGLRPVNLIGSKKAQDEAKALIMEIVESDRSGYKDQQQPQQPQQSRQGGRDHDGGRGGGMDKVNDSIWVPSEAVGMIIGKGGETIREMQNQTGCKINVSQASGPNESEREVGLVGTPDAISRAKVAIEDKVETVRQKNSGGDGRGRGRGGYGRDNQRDYDNPNNYGQNSYAQHSNQNQHAAPPSGGGSQAPAADGAADPYAAYGGYNAYVAMWYNALAQQQGAAPGQGDATKPPGTS